MADIRCTSCGEPWEYYYLRHEVGEDNLRSEGFRVSPRGTFNIVGCPCCPDRSARKEEESTEAVMRRGLADLMGDDHDGFVAMCQDFGL